MHAEWIYSEVSNWTGKGDCTECTVLIEYIIFVFILLFLFLFEMMGFHDSRITIGFF